MTSLSSRFGLTLFGDNDAVDVSQLDNNTTKLDKLINCDVNNSNAFGYEGGLNFETSGRRLGSYSVADGAERYGSGTNSNNGVVSSFFQSSAVSIAGGASPNFLQLSSDFIATLNPNFYKIVGQGSISMGGVLPPSQIITAYLYFTFRLSSTPAAPSSATRFSDVTQVLFDTSKPNKRKSYYLSSLFDNSILTGFNSPSGYFSMNLAWDTVGFSPSFNIGVSSGDVSSHYNKLFVHNMGHNS